MEELLQPRALVAAVDEAIGYLYDLEPATAIVMDADCPDLFPVLHAEYAGRITRRDQFEAFRAWLECEKVQPFEARLRRLQGPLIETTLH